MVPGVAGWGPCGAGATEESEAGWWQAWRALPTDVRAVMRSYTVRGQRTAANGSPER